MDDLKILSGGAANGLVTALTPAFTAATGLGIAGDFGAVGGMRDRILGGEAVDLVILTRAIVTALGDSGHVLPDTIADLGRVVTGIAVRDGTQMPDVSTGATLRDLLLAAGAIYFPDPQKATAGIHFAGVLDALGIARDVADRLRPHPNGQTAMAAMAAGSDASPVGCTQITEILNTPGVTYAGDLPPEHGLVTIYTAGVAAGAVRQAEARQLAAILTAPEHAAARRKAGIAE